MHERMGISTPAINKLCSLIAAGGNADKPAGSTGSPQAGLSITTINRLFMLTQPAHLQLNCGKTLDAAHRDILRAKIIRSALNG
jgi:hypothetical protein